MQNSRPSNKGHHWKFFRSGGLYQVSLESGPDLVALNDLDPKLWVALSCPVRGLHLDEATLSLIDLDKDGRIHVAEVIAAVKWAEQRLKDVGVLLQGADALPLDALDQGKPEGRALYVAARQILSRIGKSDAEGLGTADTADLAKVFPADRLAGEGVVPPEVARDGETAQLIREIIARTGGKRTANGATGVTAENVKTFFDEAAAFAAWAERGASPVIAVVGDRTEAAYAALSAVRAKVDDYFGRCRVAAFDSRAMEAVNRSGVDYAAVTSGELSADAKEVAGFPLAPAEPGRPLPLRQGVNPAWAAPLMAFYRDAVTPLLGADRTALSAGDWAALTGRFASYEAWLAAKVGTTVEPLGIERIRAILAGYGRNELESLFAEDQSAAPTLASAGDLNRLTRYMRDLRTLLCNFVNFADFYSRERLAVFQAGVLFIDNRSCELCVQVEDPATHASLANHSRTYIAYLDCRRPEGQTMKIAACVTQGDTAFLYTGRNGLFYDRAGREWDATIVKIIENPVSLREAFFAPYRRVAAFVEEQFATFASSKDKTVTENLAKGVASAADSSKPAAQPFDIAKFAGIFAAIGLALGALGGAVASVATGFMRLKPWQMPLALAGALLLVSGPSMIVAALKLRKRNLGPILEASGWAINGRVKITRPLGDALTELAALPPGSQRRRKDPYADKAAAGRRAVAIVVILVVGALIVAWKRGLWPFR